MKLFLSIFCRRLLPPLLAGPLVSPVWAVELAETLPSGFSLRGFGTLGMARSSSEQADFVRDLSQPDGSRVQWTGKVDSLLGVQANYRFSGELEGVAQVASRYRYDKSFRPKVGCAYLKYDANPGLSLRADRLGAELYVQVRFRNGFPIDELLAGLRQAGAGAAADALDVAGRRARYYSVGVVDKGSLQAQLMLSHAEQESAALENSSAGYGLLAYRISALTPYLGFSRARSRARNLTTGLPDFVPLFAVLNAGVANLIRQSHADQSTLFLGARWDVQPNVALKVQWGRVRGVPDSVAYWQGETPAWNGRTNVLSLTLDFVF